jgi:hypothetical protein
MLDREFDISRYKRLPSETIPRIPHLPVPPKPKPWHARAKAFFRQAWDDTAKIQGCKL